MYTMLSVSHNGKVVVSQVDKQNDWQHYFKEDENLEYIEFRLDGQKAREYYRAKYYRWLAGQEK